MEEFIEQLLDKLKRDQYVWFCEKCGLITKYYEDYEQSGYYVRNAICESIVDDVIVRIETKDCYCFMCGKRVRFVEIDELPKVLVSFIKRNANATKEKLLLSKLLKKKLVDEKEVLAALV